MTGNRLNAFIFAFLIQVCIAGLIFTGMILDPLIGLWVAGIYFFVVGSFLLYHYILMILSNGNKNDIK